MASIRKTKTQTLKRSEKGNVDLIDLILRDHKQLWKLVKTMKSETASFAEKKKAFKEFVPALVAHAKPEEATWYKAMKLDDDLKLEGIEGDIEHTLTNRLCSELKKTQDKDVFKAKLKVMAELLEHHLEEEEKEMLLDYKKYSSIEKRYELGQKYETLRTTLLQN